MSAARLTSYWWLKREENWTRRCLKLLVLTMPARSSRTSRKNRKCPYCVFKVIYEENLSISCAINFKDLKLNYGNFLPLLIKPIYIFFQVDGLPISRSICVGGYSRLFLWIPLFICYRNKEQNQHGTESGLEHQLQTLQDWDGPSEDPSHSLLEKSLLFHSSLKQQTRWGKD